METVLWQEVIGYTASLAVIVSVSMRSILRLRLFGLTGTVLFLVYGVGIGSPPIAITNLVIIGLHVYFLRKLLGHSETFEVLQVQSDSLFLRRFLEFHDSEIQRFQPGYRYEPVSGTTPVFILRDMVPAGLLIAVPRDDDTLEIQLDYATAQYRDFKLGRFVYSGDSKVFGRPVCIWSEPGNPRHRSYLQRMGFEERERDGRVVMQRPLDGPSVG